MTIGATPVFCDIDPDTVLLPPRPPSGAHAAHEGRAPRAPLRQPGAGGRRSTALGVPVLEDAAQAAGAKLGGRMAGALGRAATFSFFPSKNLGGFGDGGAIVTDDPEVESAARRLRFHGSEDKKHHTEAGYNSRLDEIQAASLRVLLPHLDDGPRAAALPAAGLRATPGSARWSSSSPRPRAASPAGTSSWSRHRARDGSRAALAEAGHRRSRPTTSAALPPAGDRAVGAAGEPLANTERSARRSSRCRWAPLLDAERPPQVTDAVRDAVARRRRLGREQAGGVDQRHSSSSSSSATSRILRAGTPTTTARAGTSSVTTAPAPTNASSPTSTPGQITAPPPMRQARRSVGASQRSPFGVAAHGVVVGQRHARADEDVVLDDAAGGDVAVRLHLDAVADRHVVVDRAAAADRPTRRRPARARAPAPGRRPRPRRRSSLPA